MKKILIILMIAFSSTQLLGQSQEVLDKIESAKIALITQRLDLTPEQAEKFWPIYREYSNKQREINREFQNLRRNYNPNSASEEESKRMVETGQKIKENLLNLDREYADRMLQVINNRQLLSLRKAENDFREELMRRLRRQRQMRNQQRDVAPSDDMQRQRLRNQGN